MPPDLHRVDRLPTVLLVGFPWRLTQALESRLQGAASLLCAQDEVEGQRLLEEHDPAVVALGESVTGEPARRFIADAHRHSPARSFLVLSGGSNLLRFQELIDEDALFYLSRRSVNTSEVEALVRAALASSRSAADLAQNVGRAGAAEPAYLAEVFDLADRLANQRELGEAGELAVEEIHRLVDADRAYYLLYDPGKGTLETGAGERSESAAVGLMSFVVRTGCPVQVEDVGDDPRYEQDVDDPAGAGDEHLMAVPLSDPAGQIIGALAVVRAATRPSFSHIDFQRLRSLADWVGAPLARLQLLRVLDQQGSGDEGPVQRTALFRSEALEAYKEGSREGGEPLRLSPIWMTHAYGMTLLVILAFVGFSVFGSVRVQGRGPAWVHVPAHQDVTAARGGVVEAVDAAPGERVEKDQILVRLRDPVGQGRGEEVRAHWDGLVEAVWVRPGLEVTPGQSVLAIAPLDARPLIRAVLPERYLGRIEPGMPLRLRHAGSSRPTEELRISWVSERALTDEEVRRRLGNPATEPLDLRAPAIVVEARADSMFLDAGGHRLELYDGMRSVAEVPLGSEPLLWRLFPRLRDAVAASGV